MGIVMPMVKRLHALWLNAFTTTIAKPAMAMITSMTTAISATIPVTGPTSLNTMCGSERPSWRMEPTSVVKS